MRVFLFWPNSGLGTTRLISSLQSRGHEVAYYVGNPVADDKEIVAGAIFHDHYAALMGEPATGINSSEFAPPAADLLKRFLKLESIILTMMNKRYDQISVDERRHVYYNMVQYWLGVLRKYKPQAIIFSEVPHTVYDYIVYELARYLEIKTIIFEDTSVSDRVLLQTDWRQGCQRLQTMLQNNSENNFTLADLSLDLQTYYRQYSENHPDTTFNLMHIKEWKGNYSLAKKMIIRADVLKQGIKNRTIFKMIPQYFLKFLWQNLKKEYQRLQHQPDYSKKFIYAPLNYQPERTTSPQGGIFVDQILMIEILSASIPSDWIIYVKEHPMQWLPRGTTYFSYRYRGYYQRIAKLKNVRLVPVETDTFKLIEQAQVVATVTGTAGWEAILRGKSAIIFGYPWYRDCPGAYRVDSVVSCQEALRAITTSGLVPEQTVINYLKAFDEASIHGCLADMDGKRLTLSREQVVDNLAQQIITELSN